MPRTAAAPKTGMSKRSGTNISDGVLGFYNRLGVRAIPQFLSSVWALFQENEWILSEHDVVDTREEAIVDKS